MSVDVIFTTKFISVKMKFRRRVLQRSVSLTFLIWMSRRFVNSLQLLPSFFDDFENESLINVPYIESRLRILLFITTHFSEQHLNYFFCCWPRLVQDSPLISTAHVLIASTNQTEIPQSQLKYLEDLFAGNPEYKMKPVPHLYLSQCDAYKNHSRVQSNPLKVPVNYKQCLANVGIAAGNQLGWFGPNRYDWMIRINPDVIIRKSSWLIRNMQNNSIDGIFFPCSERQLHTDFFAIRPDKTLHNSSFSIMARMRNRLNHERTAYRAFKSLLEDADKHRMLPDAEPSRGVCRLRGANASVYHVHDSCRPSEGEDAMFCNALDGWDFSL